MYLLVILSLLFIPPIFSNTTTLKSRLKSAKGGEFIVTQKDKILTLLIYHSLPSGKQLFLEEISVPKSSLSFPMNWQEWIHHYAPGHHSWTLYAIDSSTGALLSCFSFSKGEWVCTSGEASFLPKILTLSLQEVCDSKKKRVGPAPKQKSDDHRQIWTPQLVYEGKIQGKSGFNVYEAFWPNDDTELSLSHITLYFDQENASFPFPYWMQIDNGRGRATVRVIDSGTKLRSVFMNRAIRKDTAIGAEGAMQ